MSRGVREGREQEGVPRADEYDNAAPQDLQSPVPLPAHRRSRCTTQGGLGREAISSERTRRWGQRPVQGEREVRVDGPHFAETENHKTSIAHLLPNDYIDEHYGRLSSLDGLQVHAFGWHHEGGGQVSTVGDVFRREF